MGSQQREVTIANGEISTTVLDSKMAAAKNGGTIHDDSGLPIVLTLAGHLDGLDGHLDGRAGDARFDHPQSLIIDGNGRIIISDQCVCSAVVLLCIS